MICVFFHLFHFTNQKRLQINFLSLFVEIVIYSYLWLMIGDVLWTLMETIMQWVRQTLGKFPTKQKPLASQSVSIRKSEYRSLLDWKGAAVGFFNRYNYWLKVLTLIFGGGEKDTIFRNVSRYFISIGGNRGSWIKPLNYRIRAYRRSPLLIRVPHWIKRHFFAPKHIAELHSYIG